MRTRLLALIAACGVAMLGLLAASPAHAKVHKLAVAKVSIDVPKKWQVTTTEGQLNLVTKDQTLAISLTHVPTTDLDTSWGEVTPAVQGMLTGASIGERKDGVIGGMSGYVTTASGVFAGKDVQMLVALLRTPNSALLLITALGEVGRYEKHEKDMTRTLNSIVAEAPLIGGPEVAQLQPEAQKFAEQVVKAINKNDAKAFAKLAVYDVEGSGGFAISGVEAGGDTYPSAKALLKAAKKSKKLTSLFVLPERGEWHVQLRGDDATFRLWRGDWTDYVTFVSCMVIDGKWRVFEVVTDYGAMEPPRDGE